MSKLYEKRDRLRECNKLIRVVANVGRKFFNHCDNISHLTINKGGHVYFHDGYTEFSLQTKVRDVDWYGFSGGYTTKCFIFSLAQYVRTGQLKIDGFYNWGYSDEATSTVAEAIAELKAYAALMFIPELDKSLLLKIYGVTVEGFPQVEYFAASPGQARAMCWRDYTDGYGCSFRDFLEISTIKRVVPTDPLFGTPITVEGKPAFYLGQNNAYITFTYPDCKKRLHSHPNDVEGVEHPQYPREAVA